MTSLDDIYNQKVFELAAEASAAHRLDKPDATASAHSKLCGSTITVDIKVADGHIVDFGQTVKACLLGQASASIVGREIIGTPVEEFRAVASTMRSMLKQNGPPPVGKWRDLAMLEAVRDYPHRHASTLLVFDAVEHALDEIEARTKPIAATA